MPVTILTSQNPQTVINANPTPGEVFTFEAGTHNITAPLTPSANNQVFQGTTAGVPFYTDARSPFDPTFPVMKSKLLWPSGVPTAIMDGGGTTNSFISDHSDPNNYSGIVIRNLKIQNFDDVAQYGVVGGRYTQDWKIEECWFSGYSGDYCAIKVGQSMEIRNNKIQGEYAWWVKGYYAQGTALKPIIIEDNEVNGINWQKNENSAWDAVMKLVQSQHVIIRRNYIYDVKGTHIWFDGYADYIEISDNITVDGEDGRPHIFYEISPSHGGAVIRNNWCLGDNAWISLSHCHGNGDKWIEVYENTVDTSLGDRQGIVVKDDIVRSGGDSTASHPAIKTNGLPNGYHFCDRISVTNNVIRKRNTDFNTAVPLMGMNGGGTPDWERNYVFSGNKYEVNGAIQSARYRWDGSLVTFATWKTKRAAANDVQNTGPLFDVTGQEVTWSGSPQFANTPNTWQGPSGTSETGTGAGAIAISGNAIATTQNPRIASAEGSVSLTGTATGTAYDTQGIVFSVEALDNRVLLAVTYAQMASVSVYRVAPSGDIAVRGAENVAATGPGLWVGVDYEAPQAMPLRYRAIVNDGVQNYSIGPILCDGQVDYGGDYLMPVGQPGLGMNVTVEANGLAKLTREIVRDRQLILNRKSPVVVSYGRKAFSAELNLLTLTDAERESLLLLLEYPVAMFVTRPGYGFTEPVYLALGTVEEERTSPFGLEPSRRWLIEVNEVDRPPADYPYTTVGVSWQDRINAGHTWDSLQNDFNDWLDVSGYRT